MEIPSGTSREDAKARKQIIKAFYAKWIVANPKKRVWNKALGDYIHIKYTSINETAGQASISFESTHEVLRLSEILARAIKVKTMPPKKDDKNQKPYAEMRLMRWKNYRLIVGYQKSKAEWVQYYLGSEQTKK